MIDDIEKCLIATQELIPKSSPDFNPPDFYYYLLDFTIPKNIKEPMFEFNIPQLMSAATIICIDRTISNLRQKNLQDSAKFGLFVGMSLLFLNMCQESGHSVHARNAAIKRHAISPKRKEKKFIQECWHEWRKRPEIYLTKADFARAMLDKCEHLTSQKKIEDWCRDWEKMEPCQHDEHSASTMRT